MKRLTLVLAPLAALAVLLPTVPARAQVTPELRARVDEAIRLTDTHIDEANLQLAGCQSPEAQSNLQMAVTLQGQAKMRFGGATMDLDLRAALDLTGRARYRADNALRLARCCVEHDRVAAQLERTAEIIERARERAETCRHDRARALLRAAVEQQRQAQLAFAEGRCLIALQLSLSAREKALAALRACGFEERMEDRVQQFLVQTDARIERARAVVEEQGGERAHQALALAEELQGRAYAQFHENRLEASLRISRSARDAADRAERLARSGR